MSNYIKYYTGSLHFCIEYDLNKQHHKLIFTFSSLGYSLSNCFRHIKNLSYGGAYNIVYYFCFKNGKKIL